MAGSLADVHRIDNDLWAIDEIGKDIMYLIDGGRRALLIDTGFGMLDLKAIAAQLCPGREIVVVNSHAHPDHASGNNQFDCVHCGRYDEPRAHAAIDARELDVLKRNFIADNARAAGLNPDDWRPGKCRQAACGRRRYRFGRYTAYSNRNARPYDWQHMPVR